MKNRFCFSIIALFLAATKMFAAGDPAKLIINEIQVCNIDGFIDPSFNYGGWIEFYNPTDESISLGSLYVSNDPSNLKMFRMASAEGSVPAHGFRNIWFDHYDTGTKYSTQANKQIGFKLTYEGGTFYLSDKNGNQLLSQDYPAGIQRCSYARTTDGGNTWRWCSTPTPAATNEGSTFADAQLDAPVVDTDSRVFTSSFVARVNIPAGCTLRYTIDGSTPTLDNGETSSNGRFTLNSSTVVFRFRLFKDGYLPSAVVTRSYIYKDRDYYLPIVSVVTDDKNLFDNKIGAYTVGTNGISGQGVSYNTNKNRSWERPVSFDYLVPDENDNGSFLMAINQECDFEVCGGWSRNQYAPNASFRLKGGKYYLGQNFLPYQFFKDKPYIKNKGVVVRNGGNDGYGRMRDAGTHKIILSSGFYVDCQEVQPVHVFINGKYYFTFNLREPNNKNHAYANYGIDDDLLDQFEINGTKGYEQKTGDDKVFRQWMTLATRLASTPTDDSLYDQICQIVDIDEYCNYMAVECFVGCGDWLTNSNNVKGYRSREDGKFHLVFMDLDSGFGSTNMLSSLAGHLNDSRYDTGRNFLIDIFLNMLKHEPFKKRFIDAFCLVNGSVFEEQHVRKVVNALRDEKLKAGEFDGTTGNITSSANTLINGIVNNRTATMNNFRNYFRLPQGINVELSSNAEGAAILANGQEVPMGRFKGIFHTPMTLTAKAPAGYRFTGWVMQGEGAILQSDQIISTTDTWYYYDQGSLDGQNWYSLNYSANSWPAGPAPFGYGNTGINGSADYNTTIDYGDDPNNKRPTYYFRKTFTLSTAPADDEEFVLTGYVDDGCVIYVNGTEVGRYLMADGEVTYDQPSTTYASSTAGVYTVKISNQLLRRGSNVIAVEVHNTHNQSSDIYWTAELLRNKKGNDKLLSTDPQLDLSTLEGTASCPLQATYEPLPDDECLAALALPLKVNEISAGNSVFINEYFKKNDWLEIYNPTDTDLDVAGLYVTDNLNNPLKYQIPSASAINTIVPAHGHLIVWADKLDPMTQLHTTFKLNNSDNEALAIISSEEFIQNNEAYFNTHPALQNFADALHYTAHNGDQSVGRYPDGGNDIYHFNLPTIEKTNALLTADQFLMTDEGIMDNSGATLNLDLAQGWNWVSHPFAGTLSVNRFNSYADIIRGRSEEAAYSPSGGTMTGSLKALQPNQLYKVDMSEAHNYAFDGLTLNQRATIDLAQGWNWIGYPSMDMQPLASAFQPSEINAGDIIMGQAGFSVYSDADGWIGTLSTLMPGQGYMYWTATGKKIKFTPARHTVRLRKPRQGLQSTAYGLNPHAYPNVMGAIAQLYVDDQPVDVEEFTVLAYSGDECRGVGECVDGKLFMTLYGFDGDAITLKGLDAQGDEYPIQESLDFTSAVLGTRSEPLVWHMASPEQVGIAAPVQMASAAVPIGYYDLCGTYLGNTPSRLRPGIYIIRLSNGTSRKALIR